jgi:hypothetical protein
MLLVSGVTGQVKSQRNRGNRESEGEMNPMNPDIANAIAMLIPVAGLIAAVIFLEIMRTRELKHHEDIKKKGRE